jgi:hypothetical protein
LDTNESLGYLTPEAASDKLELPAVYLDEASTDADRVQVGHAGHRSRAVDGPRFINEQLEGFCVLRLRLGSRR